MTRRYREGIALAMRSRARLTSGDRAACVREQPHPPRRRTAIGAFARVETRLRARERRLDLRLERAVARVVPSRDRRSPRTIFAMSIRVSVRDDVIHVVWEGAPDDEALRAYFAELATIIARLDRYAIVYDMRRTSLPTAQQRRLLADYARNEGPRLRRSCVGVVFVIESALIRGALVAMLWLQPMTVEHLVAPYPEAAEPWLALRFRRTAATG